MERHQKVKICDYCKKELILDLNCYGDYSDEWIKVEGKYSVFHPNSNADYRQVFDFCSLQCVKEFFNSLPDPHH